MNSLGAKYTHEKLRRDADEFNFIEKMLVGRALHERLEDPFLAERFLSDQRDQQGLYINYVHPGSDREYAALAASNHGAAAAFSSQSFMRRVQGELGRIGLQGFTMSAIRSDVP